MTLRFLVGGARSGKSSLAVQMAAARDAPVTFVATGTPRDEEMAARIERHRAERPEGWTTVEEGVDLAGAVRRPAAAETVIVDCLTLWLANVLDWDEATIEQRSTNAIDVASHRSGLTVVVSNEVGSGIVPFDPDVRRYRDLLGRVNALWSDAADAAWLVVAGRVLPLRSPHTAL